MCLDDVGTLLMGTVPEVFLNFFDKDFARIMAFEKIANSPFRQETSKGEPDTVVCEEPACVLVSFFY